MILTANAGVNRRITGTRVMDVPSPKHCRSPTAACNGLRNTTTESRSAIGGGIRSSFGATRSYSAPLVPSPVRSTNKVHIPTSGICEGTNRS